MKKFMLLFRGGYPTPDIQEEHMKEWGYLLEKLNKSKHFLGGEPFDESGKLVSSKGVTDQEIDNDTIGGYMVIQASDQNEAISIAQDSPNLGLGGRVEIREIFPMG